MGYFDRRRLSTRVEITIAKGLVERSQAADNLTRVTKGKQEDAFLFPFLPSSREFVCNFINGYFWLVIIWLGIIEQ